MPAAPGRLLAIRAGAAVDALMAVTGHVIMVAVVTARVLMAVRVSVVACHTANRGTAAPLQLLPWYTL
ncbi:hypothetical protein GCM10012285_54640 [Streptomyces kronopolitis]|uniref:Uncharacterized protein n=1 Tax=Streptomyces kronopolitis TaxID=1612435 RepID=A0ABQ2JXA1_9ACTN|nr:hypothetical protein GCM10012285_54640 [Streptomyces kronopolitis]